MNKVHDSNRTRSLDELWVYNCETIGVKSIDLNKDSRCKVKVRLIQKSKSVFSTLRLEPKSFPTTVMYTDD